MKTLLILPPMALAGLCLALQVPSSKKAPMAPATQGAPKPRTRSNATVVDPPTFLLLLKSGVAAENKGDYAEAERQYLESNRLEPDWPLAYRYLALLYDKQGRNREAYAAYGRSLDVYEPRASSMRDEPGPFARFGDLAADYGTPQESREAYVLAAKASNRDDVWDPRPVPRNDSYASLKAAAHTAAAVATIWSGSLSQTTASQELDIALAADPDYWVAYHYRAYIDRAAGRSPEQEARDAATAERLAPPKGRRQVRWMRAGRRIPDAAGRLPIIPPAPRSGSWAEPPELRDTPVPSTRSTKSEP